MDPAADELIPTRATLLLRLKDWQDQSSWQEFFDTYWSLIYGVALKGGLTPAEAEDVVQETMISVAKNMPDFKYDPAIGSFKGWLLKMTRWRMADQFRRRGRQEPLEAGDDDKIDTSLAQLTSDLEKLWDAEWEQNLLKAAVNKARRRLNPRHYQIFDCYVNKGWAPDRVAKTFAVPVGQVHLAKHRVTETIKVEVERLRREVV
jgi:RNA polymerase sigma-70 factor (ECF subfamily)